MQTLTAAVLAGSLGLAAPAAGAATLRIGNGAEPGSLDPHKIGGDWEDRIVSEYLEGLVMEDPFGNSAPGQAESWTVSPDGLVYTFTLRPDAVWSDGVPVAAQDFVDGFRRLFDPATAAEYAYLQFPIRNAGAINTGKITDMSALGVTALDHRTLEITLEAPTPYFIDALAHFTALPVRQDLIDKYGDDWTTPENLVGNGPYSIVEWVPGAYIRAVKSDTFYARDTLAIDEVVWENSADLAAALRRYRAGELDIMTEFPADQYGFILKNYPGEAHVVPFLGMVYLELNHERRPFDDVRVRRVLSISIMREVLGPDVLGTGEPPALGFVPPGTGNYAGDPYVPDWARDAL